MIPPPLVADLEIRGERIPAIVARYGRRADASFEDVPIVAWAPPGTDGFLDALARSVDGKWERRADVDWLVPDPVLRAATRERRRKAALLYLQSVMEEREVELNGALGHAAARLRTALLYRIGLERLAAMEEPTVFVEGGGWGVRPLPEAAWARTIVAPGLPELAKTLASPLKPLTATIAASTFVLRYDPRGPSCSLTLVAADGTVRLVSDAFDATPEPPKRFRISAAPIPVPEAVLEKRKRSAAWRVRALDPVRWEPTSAFAQVAWADLARQEREPWVGPLPDLDFGRYSVSESDLRDVLTDVETRDGWRLGRSRFSGVVSRKKLRELLAAIRSSGGVAPSVWPLLGETIGQGLGLETIAEAAAEAALFDRRPDDDFGQRLMTMAETSGIWATLPERSRSRLWSGEPVSGRDLAPATVAAMVRYAIGRTADEGEKEPCTLLRRGPAVWSLRLVRHPVRALLQSKGPTGRRSRPLSPAGWGGQPSPPVGPLWVGRFGFSDLRLVGPQGESSLGMLEEWTLGTHPGPTFAEGPPEWKAQYERGVEGAKRARSRPQQPPPP